MMTEARLTPEQAAILDLLVRIEAIENDLRDARAELNGLAEFVSRDRPVEREVARLRRKMAARGAVHHP